ncbi:TadE/TadG family type IV pilus assembly protein [Pukyongiella litopenaei]|uniref:Pilus assembly protein n=1 Tax=Pukyongiella litopenaei TaxID=2605946 RepID=A0A2S0MK62_9RHOB|nr:TadE/TadG family type IV pilus assembly protein [Pukyongiella litopenaei]AVO36260.2 pilus assembly protein [Pukyongiella litopenaei]
MRRRLRPQMNDMPPPLRRFARREDGAMLIFIVYVLVIILMVTGVGIDLMRFERDRADLQYTLDRAVLAAADLDQPLPAKQVVLDYFNKAGLSNVIDADRVIVTKGVNYQNVSATAAAKMTTQFMHMTGVDMLNVPASGAAEERVPNVEISLVLDISGSMRNSGRMTALRPAARSFVDMVMAGDARLKSSINLIPYAGQTNPGPWMFDRLNGQRYPDIELAKKDGGTEEGRYPNVSSCLELGAGDFTHAGLPAAASYDQVPHFMNWSIASSVMDWGWCPQDRSSIVYASNDEDQLKGMIDTMRMHDGTGTQFAMKYAVALLNPSSRGIFAAMADDGLIPDGFRNRPADWEDQETAKYIVLMTDGQITEQVRPDETMHPKNPTRELLNRSSGDRYRLSSAGTNVSRFYSQCDLAKDPARNIIVYTIAFDAPSSARTQMRNCASSDAHFFVAGTDDIDIVFENIARQINQLKLVN